MLQVITFRPTVAESQTVQSIIRKNFNQNLMRLVLSKQVNYWKQVISCRLWESLKELRLNMCQINDEDIQIMEKSKFQSLIQLSLWNNNITSIAIKRVINWDLSSLTYLVLGKNNIGKTGADLLSKIKIPLLSELDLTQCLINNEGARSLTKSNWPNLTELLIHKNNIRLTGFQAIASLNNWSKLQLIDAQDRCQINDLFSFIFFVVAKSENTSIKLKASNNDMKSKLTQIFNNKATK